MDQLFKLVFGNIVLFRTIYDHVKIYYENEWVSFDQLKVLQQDHLRDYIGRIDYSGDELLSKGDLPEYGVLKSVGLLQRYASTSTPGNAIPFGVEQLKFNCNVNLSTIPLSTLPSSIHTVENVIICNGDANNEIYKIPSNIKTISFASKSIISYGTSTNVKHIVVIPNTVEELTFCTLWNNGGNLLRKGDIPEGVLALSMTGYLTQIPYGKLPNSIKVLHLTCLDKTTINHEYSDGYFNFLPPNLERLNIVCENIITPTCGLRDTKSIKNLSICFNESQDKTGIIPLSLPLTITNLTFTHFYGKIEMDVIPHSVTNLTLSFEDLNSQIIASNHLSIGSIPNSVKSLKLNNVIDIAGILPSSLTNLEISLWCHSEEKLIQEITKMVSFLPLSLTSISLPENCKNYNDIFKFPSSIKKIKYY